ncbi:MAG: exodeoxyribonuclease V subunit alpha [Deltaproteobacteria bacterium]|nr:exodeoxyribonuclease V subunit alpha [Deltaproteobacteria bacterium]
MGLGFPNNDLLMRLHESEALSPLDLYFGRFMAGLCKVHRPEVALAAALVSRRKAEGHVCLNLQAVSGSVAEEPAGDEAGIYPPDADTWAEMLTESGVVGAPGEAKPLILDPQGRLYLHRYWSYQDKLARAIHDRITHDPEVDTDVLTDGLKRLFPDPGPDQQRRAARMALKKSVAVISGGPGTGKTTTVSRILTLFIEQQGGKPARIALAAPTGKAAARMAAAIRDSKARLDCTPRVKEQIPETASTLHRLLGSISGSPYFRHHETNPLPVDLLVVDEASMIDLALMAKTVQSLLPHARIILLGDKDQLASVEAGAIFGDICETAKAASGGPFPEGDEPDAAASSQQVIDGEPEPDQWIMELTRNYRFDEKSGIGTFSRAVRTGDMGAAMAVIRAGRTDDITHLGAADPDRLAGMLRPRVLAGFGGYLRHPGHDALARFDRFRILCALREGPYGAVAVNALVEQILAREGLINPATPWYPGRPVMITRNDYHLRLFNGDVGILLPDPAADDDLRAVFETGDGSLRRLHPLRLPPHETVFAMTVHKSQGSEYDRVLFILPDRDAPVLSRELVYTAITRARQTLDMVGPESIFQTALSRRIERASGLRDALLIP